MIGYSKLQEFTSQSHSSAIEQPSNEAEFFPLVVKNQYFQ